jgi:hypothetical protein
MRPYTYYKPSARLPQARCCICKAQGVVGRTLTPIYRLPYAVRLMLGEARTPYVHRGCVPKDDACVGER